VSEEVAKLNKLTISDSRTIIFPKIGGAIATNKRRILQKPTVIDNNCLGITPYSLIDLEWAYKLLLSFDFSLYQSGTSVPAISQGPIGSIIINLPPLAEQQRIVAKIDELMVKCDALEALQQAQATQRTKTHQAAIQQLLTTDDTSTAWQFLKTHFDTLYQDKANLKELRKAILQLAVMGKLVPQDPKDQPASELLKDIAAEKERLVKEGKIKKQKPLPAIGEDEKPYELPQGWEWVRLGDVLDVRDGTHDSPKDAIGENTYPLITSNNFINGSIDFESSRRISEVDHLEISKRSKVEKFDILFSMIGGNIGNQVMVMVEREFSIKNVALFKYYDKNLTIPFFFKKIMEYLAFILQDQASGGAQPFVSLGYLRTFPIGLPPIFEQQRIVAKIDQLMALCDQLEARIDERTDKQSELLAAMMSEV